MYQNFLKRIIDFLLALCALPFILLLIAIVGIAITIDDHGPIFYRAPRMGRNGKIFKMFKFRSMKVDSPDLRNADGSTFNSEHDPRVTAVGRFLRKTSIDELPQVLNILIGDMSIIGPRPSLTTTPYEAYSEIRKKRVSVRPGMTGYSQSYYRNSISQDEKFAYDCVYVDNISFKMDVKVFIKTISSVVKRDNIYMLNNE